MWKTEQKVQRFVAENHLIESGDVLVAGISGGADSVCLFYLLLELQKKLNFRFVAVHVNHNLRGEEAREDQEFVEALCQQAQIPVLSVNKFVKEIATERKMSLEEAGRMARYEAFEEVCDLEHATKIVLAHHQDDLAETMIHHLARGTGLSGLCSLKPILGNRIRPLLCLTRQEIEEYLEKKQSSWQTDSTNLDDDYTRNKIRHHIISYLCQEVNRQAVSHMAETAREIQEVEELLGELTEKASEKFVEQKSSESILREELKMEPALIQRRIFLEEMKRLAGARRDFSRVHGEDVLALWNRQVGKKICLPYKLEAIREYQGLRICHMNPKAHKNTDSNKEVLQKTTISKEIMSKEILAEGKISNMNVSCETFIENYMVLSTILNQKVKRIVEKKYTKWFDCDRINNSLVIRHRQTGDIIRVHPSGGSKKLKDYLIDRKIPSEQRDDLWLLADGSEILWIIGDRISEKYKVSNTTSKILQVEIKGGTFHE